MMTLLGENGDMIKQFPKNDLDSQKGISKKYTKIFIFTYSE
jgi:hypothetical protein